jgi:murein DD-endopeptidase MepM/ murein hydrolase activator NlpD
MSLRDAFPKPREYASHYSISFARGERARSFALRPIVLVALLSIVPVLAFGCLGLTLLFIFRDDLLASMMARETEMQYAYEDRLASMRTQMERMKSRELLQEQAYEGRLHELFARQAQLETRASLVANLAHRAGVGADVTGDIPRLPAVAAKTEATATKPLSQDRAPNPLLSQRFPGPPGNLPSAITSFAPITTSEPFANTKPHPDTMELRLAPSAEPADAMPPPHRQSAIDAPQERDSAGVALDATLPGRLAVAASALDRVERSQVDTLAKLRAPALATAERLRIVLAETGLSPDRLIQAAGTDKRSPQGGPFVPVQLGPESSPFVREFATVQEALLITDRLRRVLPHVPLRKPLPGAPDVTSGFGVRIDPFLGRPAMHTGIDLRDDYGAPVRATAAGRVVTAEWTGGYGKMVELDHGSGLTSRYGHLSAISVREGEMVEARTIIGRIGSTGRATGPHLHYEVRIDDEAVDPTRFLRAGAKLASGE